MYRLIINLIPKNIVNHFKQLFIYGDIKKDPERTIVFMLTETIIFSLLLAFGVNLLYDFSFFITLFVSLIVIGFIMYFSIVMKVDKKTQVIESYLPDVLQLMSSNLRSGLTLDRALFLSTRSEFGVLKDEINLVGKQITAGKSISDALLDMTKRVRSKTFEKSVLLIISGLKSGGELASLIEETASDLVQKKIVDKKVRTSVNLYVIFIFIAIGLGAPLLFGISSYLIGILTNIFSKVDIPDTNEIDLPFQISSTVNLKPEFVMQFSLIFLVVTVILGSLVLGLITKGKEKYGIRYIIPLLISSLGLFFFVRVIINNLLGGVLNIA